MRWQFLDLILAGTRHQADDAAMIADLLMISESAHPRRPRRGGLQVTTVFETVVLSGLTVLDPSMTPRSAPC
jgi:hypothetical protein